VTDDVEDELELLKKKQQDLDRQIEHIKLTRLTQSKVSEVNSRISAKKEQLRKVEAEADHNSTLCKQWIQQKKELDDQTAKIRMRWNEVNELHMRDVENYKANMDLKRQVEAEIQDLGRLRDDVQLGKKPDEGQYNNNNSSRNSSSSNTSSVSRESAASASSSLPAAFVPAASKEKNKNSETKMSYSEVARKEAERVEQENTNSQAEQPFEEVRSKRLKKTAIPKYAYEQPFEQEWLNLLSN
jgi:hypothetical protein